MDLPFLPSEIIFDIISRLSAKDVIRCKCVCKSWLKLIETPEFVKDHLSKSTPGLIVCNDSFELFGFADELELEHDGLHSNLIEEFGKIRFTRVSFNFPILILGSVNGLLLLCSFGCNILYICNPITHEYIDLPCFEPDEDDNSVSYGFGVSVKSGLYKVIRIRQELDEDTITKSECWVYTLGREEWKSVTPCPFYDYCYENVLFNGNLHWLIDDLNNGYLISYFDLETEEFSTINSLQPCDPQGLVVLENCLCICGIEVTGSVHEFVIWVMKEYANDKSWTKQYVFMIDCDLFGQKIHDSFYPLKVYEGGDILLLWGLKLFYYLKKTNTLQKLDLFDPDQHRLCSAWLHVSSFISLLSLTMETVRKF